MDVQRYIYRLEREKRGIVRALKCYRNNAALADKRGLADKVLVALGDGEIRKVRYIDETTEAELDAYTKVRQRMKLV